MTISTEERLAKVHAQALAEFDLDWQAVYEEREQCLADRRFYSIAGSQWEGDIGDAFANKPRLEFNKVHLAVIRVINEYRNNRITVDFTPKDGSDGDKQADTCDGLYRADEQASVAEEAYDNAFEEGVGGGFGAWRLRACYEDEDDDDNDAQRVAIEPIFDADSCVFFDRDAKRYDKSDARRAFVLSGMSPEAYEDEWNDAPTSWPKDISRAEFDWCTPDVVYVAEYYRVEEVSELVHYLRGLVEDEPDMAITDAEIKDDPERLEKLKLQGFRVVRQKRVKRRKVHKYILSGGRVLEDCGYIAGKHIPIVPYYGKRWVVDGRERCMGHVRLAKDAQRLNNMLMSWLGQMAFRFDVEKPILTPEQIAGHAQQWAQDAVENYPYLTINAILGPDGSESIPTLQYTKAPNVPPAMAALAQLAGQALSDLLGNQQAGEEMRSNVSGDMMEMVQQRLDMQTFIYMSNLAKSHKRSGEIWLSMNKDLRIEENRKAKVVHADGQSGSVVLNQPGFDKEAGKEIVENDMTAASFDVVVDVGPSSSSKRSATVRSLTAMKTGTTDPEMVAVLDGMILMNLEGEGLSDVHQWSRRRLIKMGVVKPTEEEAKELMAEQQGKGPDPQSAALLGMAKEAEAKAAKANADTLDTLAAADLKAAQTIKTRVDAGISLAQASQPQQIAPNQPPAQ